MRLWRTKQMGRHPEAAHSQTAFTQGVEGRSFCGRLSTPACLCARPLSRRGIDRKPQRIGWADATVYAWLRGKDSGQRGRGSGSAGRSSMELGWGGDGDFAREIGAVTLDHLPASLYAVSRPWRSTESSHAERADRPG